MESVEEYIRQFPMSVQVILQELRELISNEAPLAVESISYGMPAYKLNGKPLIYFAGYKSHIGLYALPSGHQKFKSHLAPYKQGKGSVQFPINAIVPFLLIREMVQFRVAECTNS